MEYKIKQIVFVKISSFILLMWIRQFNNDVIMKMEFSMESTAILKKNGLKKVYDDFLEKNRRIGDIALNKIKLSVLLKLAFISTIDAWVQKISLFKGFYSVLGKLRNDVKSYIYIAICGLIIIEISVIVIIEIYRVLRNNEKYKKLMLMME
ncbi:fam-m protein [Plasmodium brasilianum]|uniref:fam-m protein n=1 Tax=Plasmodium brasilianum TaxID=5824 RepID=UPI00350E5899|nr:fam-m protein [Plasmodium brasilianum]